MLRTLLTPEILKATAGLKTDRGVGLLDCIGAALAHPDTDLGLYAGDAQSYHLFNSVFAPAVERIHGNFVDSMGDVRLTELDSAVTLPVIDSDYFQSIRISVSRNVEV
jgi:hypothetical protein